MERDMLFREVTDLGITIQPKLKNSKNGKLQAHHLD